MYNIFIANFKTENAQLIRRLILLNSFLIVGVLIVVLLAFFNFSLQEYKISILNIGMSLLGIGIFVDLRYNNNIDRAAIITVIALIGFYIVFLYLNENIGFGLIWTHVVPILSIGLLGAKKGALISFIYFIIIGYNI